VRKFLFVFDTTGSMREWIQRATMDIATLSTEVLSEDRGSQVGFIAYGDHCDGSRMIQDSTCHGFSSHREFGLYRDFVPAYTSSSSDIERWLLQEHGTSGGDAPEAVECVLKHIADIHLKHLPVNDQLIVFWVGDAGPHHVTPRLSMNADSGCPAGVNWEEQLQRLAVGGVAIYTALCGNDSFAKQVWDTMASSTGGVSVDLKNIRNLMTTMIAVVKKETGGLDEYAKKVREYGADAEMEEILVDLGATCHDR
jgi:hypothetical protein